MAVEVVSHFVGVARVDDQVGAGAHRRLRLVRVETTYFGDGVSTRMISTTTTTSLLSSARSGVLEFLGELQLVESQRFRLCCWIGSCRARFANSVLMIVDRVIFESNSHACRRTCCTRLELEIHHS